MTVRELIQELEKIENKDLDVVMLEGGDYNTTDTYEIQEVEDYYYGKQEKDGYIYSSRRCIFIG